MRLLVILLAVIVYSCTTYSEDELQQFDQEIESYIKKNGLNFSKTDEGLYYRIIKEGDGRKIQYNDSVLIAYKGTLLDGKVVDYQKKPIWFAVKDLIAGWKSGLTTINKNGVLELIVPPQLGYGNHKLDFIPENSILYYELKVFDIH
jgi:FKBP-type peptidyl-prolyl cis-trans isomerase FkpA